VSIMNGAMEKEAKKKRKICLQLLSNHAGKAI
jgi:hypothetical protein